MTVRSCVFVVCVVVVVCFLLLGPLKKERKTKHSGASSSIRMLCFASCGVTTLEPCAPGALPMPPPACHTIAPSGQARSRIHRPHSGPGYGDIFKNI